MLKYITQVRTLIFLLIAAGAATQVSADWRKQESGTLAWLHAVHFLDTKRGFAAGSNGTLLSTTDGGDHWKKLALRMTDTIRDVHFLNRTDGWMLCDRGKLRSGGNPSYLLRTKDGGGSWSPVEFRTSPERFSRLIFSPDGKGYLVGEGGVIVGLPIATDVDETRDPLPERYLIVDGAVAGDSRMLLAGGGGTLLLGDHGTRNWRSARFDGGRPGAKLNAIFFLDGKSGWIAGNGGLIFSTANGGETWQAQVTGIKADILDIAMADRANGFAVGDSGIILSTADAGLNWSAEKSGSRHRFERVAFAGRRAIVVGFGGTILAADLN